MGAELIPADVLFGDDHGPCCDCCEGYCPRWESPADYRADLWTVVVNGVEYVTDRYLMVRKDAVSFEAELSGRTISEAPSFAVKPDEKPGPSTSPQTARVADAMARAGLECCGTEPSSRRHLYQGAEHVGWVTVARDPSALGVVSADDLPTVQQIAKHLHIRLNDAAAAFNMSHGSAS